MVNSSSIFGFYIFNNLLYMYGFRFRSNINCDCYGLFYFIYMIDFFINNHAGFWSEIAHRRSRYASFVNKSHDRWGIQCGSRHCALNLSNSNTIELRIFKSTTNIHEFKRILSFCSGVANFIKTNIHINDHNKEEKFIEYMKNNYDYI